MTGPLMLTATAGYTRSMKQLTRYAQAPRRHSATGASIYISSKYAIRRVELDI